ncbi:hypothetical protein [Nocardiopsis lambiniae]|uniref:Uncharacterized protein n=1 Tax=Nocardiopsis lambiniae TaxID=3075539 RepID=A0ABU2MHM5_9ACTN|nr:hypothetical protein [Nocardiopsis sp. DSM 44743]MDT0332064.1 hypothetical protein [Nocardiopsis sp. DSM 44743]
MSAIPASEQPYRRPVEPADLVGRWVRLDHDASVGVLDNVRRETGAIDWEWDLRTSEGTVSGTGPLVARPLTDPSGLRSARRRLRAVRADLTELASPDDPALTRATEDLDLLELEAAALP